MMRERGFSEWDSIAAQSQPCRPPPVYQQVNQYPPQRERLGSMGAPPNQLEMYPRPQDQGTWPQQPCGGNPGWNQPLGGQQPSWGSSQQQSHMGSQQPAWGSPQHQSQMCGQQAVWGSSQNQGQQMSHPPAWGGQPTMGGQQFTCGSAQHQSHIGGQQPAWQNQSQMGGHQPAWGSSQPPGPQHYAGYDSRGRCGSVDVGQMGNIANMSNIFAAEPPKDFYRREDFRTREGTEYSTYAVPKKVNPNNAMAKYQGDGHACNSQVGHSWGGPCGAGFNSTSGGNSTIQQTFHLQQR